MTPAILGLATWISDSALALLYWSVLLPVPRLASKMELEYVMAVHFIGAIIFRLACRFGFTRNGLGVWGFVAIWTGIVYTLAQESGSKGLFIGFILAGLETIIRFLRRGMKTDEVIDIPVAIVIASAFAAALITGPFGLKRWTMIVWGALNFMGLGVLEIRDLLKIRKAAVKPC